MMNLHKINILRVFCIMLAIFCFANAIPSIIWAGSNANFKFEIISFCGNGVVDSGEQCDYPHLAGQTCVNQGFSQGGILTCRSDCSLNTSQCVSNPGGGGGGGGSNYDNPVTGVDFVGRAYPMSKVVILKDGQVAVSTIAGPDANFEARLTGLTKGNYTFSVYGEDSRGLRSSVFTFPASITSGATTKISGIFIAPTISVSKTEVKAGENVSIFGQSVPNGEVTISIHSAEEIFSKINADINGAYLYNFDTSVLEVGKHLAKSKSALGGEISSFSNAVSFTVNTGDVAVLPETPSVIKGDLNSDKRINLVDFSILAYWYKKTLPTNFKLIEGQILNNDGVIDLVDFSILAFNWTG